ncbi:MAG: dTMP kinase [Fretibacterium sp.]|nr:dTMP kinase [Fretibacterium sp.]
MTMTARRGTFITLEGIDGCGKSVQAGRLFCWLREHGWDVERTFEPGGWQGGKTLRSLVLNGEIADAETELLIFLADRSGHLASVIWPALEAGRIVLCERYSDSTWAYQVGGRGLDPAKVRGLMELCGFPQPDLTIFLEISPEAAAERLVRRGKADCIETGGIALMSRVAGAYAELAAAHPERIVTVPAGGTEEKVALCIQREMERVLFSGRTCCEVPS